MKKIARYLAVLTFTFFTATTGWTMDGPIYTGTFSNKAVSGYDTVSYFQGTPQKGASKFKTKWRGADWYFVSQENLDLFLADPERYAPQYGGYCAWAMANDNLVKSDPQQWHIEDGKLYLNYNKSIKEKWLPRREELIPVADKKWLDVIENR